MSLETFMKIMTWLGVLGIPSLFSSVTTFEVDFIVDNPSFFTDDDTTSDLGNCGIGGIFFLNNAIIELHI